MPSEKRRKFKGRLYRVSDLPKGPKKTRLVKNLMKARRDVGTALKKKDKTLERKARNRVHKYKKQLGER
tara:strand:- start:307 stop:513 length:207 start_codon:yes stop_codon:yes gene_type:complete